MPFESEAQRRFFHWKFPKKAMQWEKETPKNADLPEHVKDEKKAEEPKKK